MRTKTQIQADLDHAQILISKLRSDVCSVRKERDAATARHATIQVSLDAESARRNKAQHEVESLRESVRHLAAVVSSLAGAPHRVLVY